MIPMAVAARGGMSTAALSIGPLRLALVAASGLHLCVGFPGGDGLRSVLGDPNGATQWASLTPFVPPHHLKKNGRNALQGQVATELASRGRPFCSERCRLIDLGAWLDEGHRIPMEEADADLQHVSLGSDTDS